MEDAANEAGVPFTTKHAGTMFGGFFTDRDTVTNYEQVMACDTAAFSRFFHAMLDNGVYLAPASYEAGFISAAHGDAELNATLDAARAAFKTLAG
jgi:glutamate-1-semialdehyde 2,1-aminomutase